MDGFYRVTEIEKNIYRINSEEAVNSDLFVGTEKALLLDTGYGLGDLKSVVRRITGKPLILVNTHGHMDHTGGNDQFAEEVYIHPADIRLAEEHTGRRMRQQVVEDSRKHLDWEHDGPRDILPKDFDADEYLSRGTGKLRTLKEGERFELGDITLRVLYVPGHTKGSIALFYEEENWIYLGDSMNPFLFLFLPESESLSVYKDSIKKIQAVKPDRMYISHADQPLPAEDLELFLKCAEQVDYEKGIPFHHMLSTEGNARICVLPGFTMKDMGRPGFAAVVISPDKLKE